MSNIFVTSTAVETQWDPYALSNCRRVIRAAEQDVVGRHVLVGDADSADVILFVGSRAHYHFDILASPLYQSFRERCFVFDSQDNALPLIPGIYMGIPEHLLDCSIYRHGFYIRVIDNKVLREEAPFSDCKYLFSFVGRGGNAPVRRAVLGLNCSRAMLKDSWSRQSDGDESYAAILAESKFVVCPRGIGPSSWRVFEAMRTGRSPVIISDQWRPPPGPRWDDFAIIVAEDEVATLPDRLASLEPMAETMGATAYAEWQNHFSRTRAFHWIGETLQAIQRHRDSCRELTERWRIVEALRSPLHRRSFFRERIREAWLKIGGRHV